MNINNWLSPVTLEGVHVKLFPLLAHHKPNLLAAAADGELWKLWYTSVPSADSVDAYLNFASEEAVAGRSLAFVVTDKASGKIIGTTRFCNAVATHRRVEIGYTWYAKTYQRTSVNTECKYLLLSYAFDTLKCIAVEFRTHWHNQASRNAIARLGAKQDGVLRNHQIDSKGSLRDTVVFSILAAEWPTVKQSLEYKLAR